MREGGRGVLFCLCTEEREEEEKKEEEGSGWEDERM